MEKHRPISPLKFALAAGGSAFFFVLAIAMAWHTRHCRMTGVPLFNGKGGRMTCAEGYCVAGALFSMAFGYFVFAWRYWRERPE